MFGVGVEANEYMWKEIYGSGLSLKEIVYGEELSSITPKFLNSSKFNILFSMYTIKGIINVGSVF